MREWLTIYLKGACMGAADIVPGVSGGTIALIVGIYDRLIAAIAAIGPKPVLLLPKLSNSYHRAQFYANLRAMDLPFLLTLGAGIATAVLVVSRLITIALDTYTAPVYAFFCGLIAASAVVLYRQVDLDTTGRIAAAIAGFTIAYVVSGFGATAGRASLLAVFVAGAIAIAAMVLPGVSGAVILLILGQYEYMLTALTDTVDGVAGLVQGAPLDDLMAPATVVVTFLIGATIGLLTVARAVRLALDRYRLATLAFLVSLMAGSLRLPVEIVLAETATWTATTIATLVIAGLMGAIAVLALDHYTDSLEYVD